ncbi:alpha beta hydrolase fold-3 domain containing protein [Seiridium cupressi]
MPSLESNHLDAPGFPLKSYQPLRFLYWLGYKTWILARVPFWLVRLATFPRPHASKKWTLFKTLVAWIGREESELFARLGITEELSLEPGEDEFKVIAPGALTLYTGPLHHPDVQPAPIGITWFPPAKPIPGAADLVVLHLHGGAFVWGSGRAKQMRFLADTLLTEAGVTSIYAPQYRLSGYGGQNPFPAALQDSLTSYLYLLNTLDLPPDNIIISGDSAGGTLAISLIRYIEEFGPQLGIPRPLGAVFVSPWVEPGSALGPTALATFKSNPHWATDYMPFEMCAWAARVYTALVSVEHPYITALGHPFSSKVPMLLTVGEAEVLEVECTAWVKEMKAVAGNRVETYYEDAAPHDTLLLGADTGWAESAKDVARSIGAWSTKVMEVQ